MGFEYITNTTAVVTALKDNNTTSTGSINLSSALSTAIQTITADDPESIAIRFDKLPQIFVRLSDKEENFDTLGGTGSTLGARKMADVTYDVIGFMKKEGAYSPHSTLLTDTYTMARNIEAVFQEEFTLSGTALWCQPVKTEFSPAIDKGNHFIKVVLIQLKAKYLFR